MRFFFNEIFLGISQVTEIIASYQDAPGNSPVFFKLFLAGRGRNGCKQEKLRLDVNLETARGIRLLAMTLFSRKSRKDMQNS